MDWSLCRTFLAVLYQGTLSGAARSLGLTQPTVGRQVEALEQSLGTPLFTRSGAGLRPTEIALSLRPHAEAMAAAAETLERTASGEADKVEGAIRITASEIVGAEVLPPILTGFHDTYPGVAIELTLSNRQEDLLRREADIAVRMTRPTQGQLLARRLGVVRVGLFAHRRHIERYGRPASFADARPFVIGFDRDVQVRRSLEERQIPLAREAFAFRSDSDLAQLAFLRAGFGVGACQVGIARGDPALVPVLEDAFRYEMEAWVAMHEDLKSSRRMRLMFDWLVQGLGDYIASQPP